MKNILATVLCAAMCLLAVTGCHHKVDSTNPAVIKAVGLYDARKTINSVAHGLKAANDTVQSVSASEPDEYAAYYAFVHPKLVELAKLNDQADDCVTQAENGGTCDWRNAVAIIAQKAGDPHALATFGFKNKNTQRDVQLGFAALVTSIQLAQQFSTQ